MSFKKCVVKITQGGGVAAPVGGQIFSEVLPYLEIEQGNQEEVEVREEIEVPNVINMNLTDAIKTLNEAGFEVKINNETDDVNAQTPSAGIKAYSGSCVYLN